MTELTQQRQFEAQWAKIPPMEPNVLAVNKPILREWFELGWQAGRSSLESELSSKESARIHTQDWYAQHYGKLHDWARTRLPEEWRDEFFCCIANGTWGFADVGKPYMSQAGEIVPSNYFRLDSAAEQILHDQSTRAEKAESENAELKKQLTYFDELQARYGKNWHTEVANRLEVMQERDLYKESIKAANERLESQGLVLFNYPSKPEGCRSNIQWRNVRAEKAESENAKEGNPMTDNSDLQENIESNDRLAEGLVRGVQEMGASQAKLPVHIDGETWDVTVRFRGAQPDGQFEDWVIEAARQILAEIALEKPRLRTSRIAEIIQAARGSSPAPSPHPEAFCQECGRPNESWFAANELWNLVMGSPNGIICPVCFIRRADKVITCTGWQLVPENRSTAL